MKNDRIAVSCVISLSAALLLGACSRAPESAASPATAAANIADTDVTTNVNTALIRSPALKGQDIHVTTLKGDVRLTGVLDTQAQIDDALAIARAAAGVHSIHDELTLRK